MLVALQMAVLVLLSVVGIDVFGHHPLSANEAYVTTEADATHEVLVADWSPDSRKGTPTSSEEPVSRDEEERTDDDKTEEKTGEDKAHFNSAYSFSGYVVRSLKASSHYLLSSSYRASVPLYVLFHSWKNFLI